MTSSEASEDLTIILQKARELSIVWKHGFINYDHIFVAMHKHTCLAKPYLGVADADLWETKTRKAYEAEHKKTARDGGVPLTKTAERVLRHSSKIASNVGDTTPNTVHVLLAILNFDNEVTCAFEKAGMLIDDITLSCYNKVFKKFPRIIKPIRIKLYSKPELFCLYFFSVTSKKKLTLTLYQNAVDLCCYRQYHDAIGICRIGLDISPKNLDLSALLATCLQKIHQWEAAIPLLEALVTERPENLNYKLNLAIVLEMTGNLSDAIAIIDSVLAVAPDNAAFLNNRGFYLIKQEKYAESVSYFEKAVKNTPERPYAWNNLGFAKFKLGDAETGLSYIDKAIELDKSNSFAYKNKGIIFMEQGNKNEALINFNLALKFGYSEQYDDEVTLLLKKIS